MTAMRPALCLAPLAALAALAAMLAAAGPAPAGGGPAPPPPAGMQALRSDDAVHLPPALPPPLFGVPARDPVFGTTVTRVTDPGQGASTKFIRHYYAKSDPFNADASLAVMHGSDGSVHLYDAAQWRPVQELKFRIGEPETHWHPSDPGLLYHLDSLPDRPAGRGLYRYDVRRQQDRLLHAFDDHDRVSGLLEGNLDAQGRYLALVGEKAGRREAFVYDLREDRITARLPVSEAMVADWISVSPSGRFVVMMGKDRSRVFDIGLKLLRELPPGSFGHGDLCRLADGEEALVYDGADRQLDHNRNINLAMLASGAERRLLRIGWKSTPHVSCRNLDMPGWALVSTQGPDPKYPVFDFEVLWLKLDGSGEVRRLAHHHSRRDKGGYFAEQHAVSDRSGERILFASNWDGTAAIADYLLQWRAPAREKARTP